MNRRKFLSWLGMAPAVIPAIAAADAVAAERPATVNGARAVGCPSVPIGGLTRPYNSQIDLNDYADWSSPPYGLQLHYIGGQARVVYFGETGKPIFVKELTR